MASSSKVLDDQDNLFFFLADELLQNTLEEMEDGAHSTIVSLDTIKMES